MHISAWFWFALVVLVSWGVVGLLQKLSTNYLSAEWALIWLAVGFFILEPWLYPGHALFAYSLKSLGWAFLGGVLNALGAWALLAALKSGGKASVVAPFTALYPVVVVFSAPVVLHESITARQAIGVLCALIAVVLLSTESPEASAL
ncbi:MAG TPA: EamA family transporter [Terriglobia bacterium]|nr:EamA family transporter [Terriglobia bacterium]